jgi:hypothetical protein
MTHDTSRWKPAPLRLRLAAAQCEEEQKKGAAKAEVQAAKAEVRAAGAQLKLASLVARDWEVWESGVLFDPFRSCFCQFAFYCIKKFLM